MSTYADPIERLRELEEAGLEPALAHEAVLEEQAQQRKEKTMPRGTGLTGRKPDFSSLKHQRAIGVHDGVAYSERDLEHAEAANGLGTSAKPDADVVFHTADTSPTLKRWKREEAERQKAREEKEREVLDEARRRLDAEADEAKREAEVQQAMERIRSGNVREAGR